MLLSDCIICCFEWLSFNLNSFTRLPFLYILGKVLQTFLPFTLCSFASLPLKRQRNRAIVLTRTHFCSYYLISLWMLCFWFECSCPWTSQTYRLEYAPKQQQVNLVTYILHTYGWSPDNTFPVTSLTMQALVKIMFKWT